MTCPVGGWKYRSRDGEGELGHYEILHAWTSPGQGLWDVEKALFVTTELGGRYAVDGHRRDRERQSEVLTKERRKREMYIVEIWPPLEYRGGVHKPLFIIPERKVNQFRDLGFSV